MVGWVVHTWGRRLSRCTWRRISNSLLSREAELTQKTKRKKYFTWRSVDQRGGGTKADFHQLFICLRGAHTKRKQKWTVYHAKRIEERRTWCWVLNNVICATHTKQKKYPLYLAVWMEGLYPNNQFRAPPPHLCHHVHTITRIQNIGVVSMSRIQIIGG